MISPGVRPRILCVDDEPYLLAALSRSLRMSFDVVTAVGGAAGLARIAEDPSFAVIVSDLRMPEMDGVTFLRRVREEAPDAVRVLLTGQADLTSAIGAVNDGQVFRFLVKPCAPDVLLPALSAACEQHRLVTSERVLLEQTLQGCIKALIELLAVVHPAAFGRATRVKRHAGAIAEKMAVPDRWQVDVAALLSQIGTLTLRVDTAERLYAGHQLNGEERLTLERLPELAARLVANIPRLEEVAAILQHQQTPFLARPGTLAQSADMPGAAPGGSLPAARSRPAPSSRAGGLADATPRAQVPVGARILKVALDLDELESRGYPAAHALDVMESRFTMYDPAVLRALRALHDAERSDRARVVDLPLGEVQLGMIFAVDVVGPNGLLLVARGQEVTLSVMDRVRNHWQRLAATLQVRMIIPGRDEAAAPADDAPHSVEA